MHHCTVPEGVIMASLTESNIIKIRIKKARGMGVKM